MVSKEEALGMWNSTEQMLPEADEVVLLYGGGDYYTYMIGVLTEDGRWAEEYEGSFIPAPSHWMKLAPPKEIKE